MTEPQPEPAPADAPPPPTGPACGACGGPAIVHWQRRLTPDEITAHRKIEQDRRDEALLLADPQLPPPDFGPMPDGTDWTRVVHGCYHHAITADAAAHIHQADCTAPATAHLPGCDCTPEAPPPPAPSPAPVQLPPGW